MLNYLARYVFRIAITNHRLVSMDESHVTFRYKDHDTEPWQTERLEGVQFLRCFLYHVLPRGFHKVRYYGLWHPSRKDRQAGARLLLELTELAMASSNEGSPNWTFSSRFNQCLDFVKDFILDWGRNPAWLPGCLPRGVFSQDTQYS